MLQRESLTSAGNFLYVKEKAWEVAVFPSGVQWAEDQADICLLPYTHLLCTCAFSAPAEICLSCFSKRDFAGLPDMNWDLKKFKESIPGKNLKSSKYSILK